MAIYQNLYELLTHEEDARHCRDIDERACRESPRSFAYLFASYFLTKLGDAIASPKTTLAWVTTAVGAPAFVLGLLERRARQDGAVMGNRLPETRHD